MKTTTLSLSLLACCLILSCAPTFKKGFKAYARQDYAAAKSVFEYYRERPTYASASRYFLAKMDLAGTRDLPGLLRIDSTIADTDSLLRRLPVKKALRLSRKFGADSSALRDLREQTQRWAIAHTRTRGTLPALDSLLDGLPQPLPVLQPEIDAAHRDIVNTSLETADYDTMTAILRRHIDYVLPENYEHTRRMSDELWTAFLSKYSPCDIDRFARDHPMSFAGRDCWRDTVRALLCTGSLADLLDFHAANRWTALEIVLLNAIADRADSSAAAARSPEQQQHLRDLQSRTSLRGQFSNGSAARDTAAALDAALEYIRRYAPRYSAFRLMEESLQFFLDGHYYDSAIRLLEEARPFYPDTMPGACQSNFDYQRRVRPWIDGKLPILRRPAREVTRRPLATLNTPEGEEYSPVVRADGREIFFAAKNRPGNLAGADIFTAQWDTRRNDWASPTLVPELSGAGHQSPLSISADGRQILLLVNGRLQTSRRSQPGAPWSPPAPLPVGGIAILGKGCLSADGNILVLEGAYSAGGPTQSPDLDLFVSLRDPDTGEWSRPAALGANINTDGQETSPYLSPDGRTLWYASTGYPGLGGSDIFVSQRIREDWTHWTRPENLGKERNNTFPHLGYTTVSGDRKTAWESAAGDLWELHCADGF